MGRSPTPLDPLNLGSQDIVELATLAKKYPDRDPKTILKLRMFAIKLRADKRSLGRLTLEADICGHTQDEIAAAAGISVERVHELIERRPDAENWPRTYREPGKPTVVDLLRVLKTKTENHKTALEWWIIRAADHGWSVAVIAKVAEQTPSRIRRVLERGGPESA